MMYRLILVSVGYLLLINNVCEASALEKFGEGNQKFSSDSYGLLAIQSGNNSIIFSPLSAQLILSQTSEGARNETARQLISALHLPNRCLNHAAIKQLILNTSSDVFTLIAANRIYVAENYQLLQSFLDVSEQVYRADAVNVDFSQSQQTADLINTWIAQQTNNKIQNLINPGSLSGTTRVILVNTLYVNGKWVVPFLENTTNGTFYLANGSTKQVQMMNSDIRKSSSYKYFDSSQLGATFLQIDLQNSNLSMTFVLPKSRNGLGAIENNVESYVKLQNYNIERVQVSIPTFEITSNTMDLGGILQQLGVTDLFNENQADLKGISRESGLFVSQVLQKAFINVTVTGVEAAAATAVGISTTSVQLPPTLTFIANHPFLYYISDRINGIVYFIGRYTGV